MEKEYTTCRSCGQAVPKCALGSHKDVWSDDDKRICVGIAQKNVDLSRVKGAKSDKKRW